MDVQKYPILDWDDVRVFLAFARTGSLSGAARALGVNHTTVARRLASLETALGGRPLMEKRRDGYVLTRAGLAAFDEAGRMELASQAFRRAADIGEELSGPVRVSSVASFGERILAPALAVLAARHPGLGLELVAEDRNVQLAKGEADIAVRLGRPSADEALARQVGEVSYHLYASSPYLAATPPQGQRFIGFSDHLARTAPGATRLRELAGARQMSVRCSSFAAQAAAAAAGAGLAMLPAYLGGDYPGLVRAEPEAERVWWQPVWLLVRADVRRVGRVRRVADAIAGEIATRSVELSGG